MTPRSEIESLIIKGQKLIESGDPESGAACLTEAADALLSLASQLRTTKADTLVSQASELIDLVADLQTPAAVGCGERESESPLVKVEKTGVTFDDLAGLEEPKARLYRDLIRPALDATAANRWNRTPGGALLLYGPPGSGKTMFAKAVAGELGVPFFELRASTVLSKWVSESEKNIRRAFDELKEHPRCVLFLDEVDGLLAARKHDSTAMHRVVSEFLAAMDGVGGRQAGLYVLAATNHPENVDAAVKRSLRFGRPVYVGLPDAAARTEILKKNLARMPVDPAVNLQHWGSKLERYSGADIAELCRQASDHAWDREEATGRQTRLNEEDLVCAQRRVIPSCSEKDLLAYEDYHRRNGGG